MKFVKIPKKSGGHRIICKPDKSLKNKLREILRDSLNYKQLLYCDQDVVHGFMPTKSIVTNAKKHIGYKYTLSLDIKDFFDSVTPDMVKKYLTQEEIDACFIDGHIYQGLPTSPAIANLAAIELDKQIIQLCKIYCINKDHFQKEKESLQVRWVYTRYADDISISFDEFYVDGIDQEYQLKTFILFIYKTISSCNFTVNPKKTRLQSAKFGKREITGLFVDDKCVSTNSKFKKRLRAVLHKNKGSNQAIGLEEFAKCYEPTPYMPLEIIDNLINLCKANYVKALLMETQNGSSLNIESTKWQQKIKQLEESKVIISKYTRGRDQRNKVKGKSTYLTSKYLHIESIQSGMMGLIDVKQLKTVSKKTVPRSQ